MTARPRPPRPWRGRRSARLGLFALLALLGAPPPARAQLRPIEPIPWEVVSAEGGTVRVGVGWHAGARATLAGTRGSLLELGDLTATWSFGRAALEVGGTVLRVFEDDSTYAEPIHDARASDGTRRTDTGEHRLGTVVRLTTASSPIDAVFRFGTRLPTTDNAQGLGRDQTDFYGTFGGRWRRAGLELTGEAGVGILETRLARPEQVDVLLYAARVAWVGERGRVWLEAVGQHDPRSAPELRGLEDLGEARLVGELGGRRLLRVTLVRGLQLASPELGVVVAAAVRF
jgi:hypothetical protein